VLERRVRGAVPRGIAEGGAGAEELEAKSWMEKSLHGGAEISGV